MSKALGATQHYITPSEQHSGSGLRRIKSSSPHRNFKANMSYRRLSFLKKEKNRGRRKGENFETFSMIPILWLFVIATKDRT